MQHRIIFALTLICLSLIGATPAISQDYAIVDDNPFTVRGYYATIGAALASGASTIEVRDGVYAESVTLDRPLTLLCRNGATLINDGLTVSLSITAAATVKDCHIEGNHDGQNIGDYTHGTGFYVLASGVTLDGVSTANLRSFSVLAPTATTDLLLENYDFSNVACDPNTYQRTQYAIHFTNGSSNNVVRNGRVSCHSQAFGAWLASSRNRVYGNEFIDNYGYVGSGSEYTPRSSVEVYGEAGNENYDNYLFDNTVDGSHGSGFEIADIQFGTVVRDNVIRNTTNCFGANGSGTDRIEEFVFEGNTCYGTGQPQPANLMTGKGRVAGNLFIDYVNLNEGTLLILGTGDVEITGNTFIRNGWIARITAPNVRLTANIARDSVHLMGFYLDNEAAGAWIAGNEIDGGITANASYVTVKDNRFGNGLYMNGAAVGDVIMGNEIQTTGFGIVAPSESVVSENRIDSTYYAIHIPANNTGYTLISENYIRAGLMDVCSGTNTCRYNYTAGQTP